MVKFAVLAVIVIALCLLHDQRVRL
jgi:hypothetical protein